MLKRRYDRAAIVLGVAWTLFCLIVEMTTTGRGGFVDAIGQDEFVIPTIIGWAVLAIWPAIRWIKGGE